MNAPGNLLPDRLPLRVEPAPGEAWPTYLERVASVYRCHPALLVAPINDLWQRRLRRDRPSPAVAGVGMAPDTATATAHRLNLAVHEVQQMHLSAHDGVSLTLPRPVADMFDPAHGRPTIHKLADAGWVGRPAVSRWCPSCEQLAPGVRLLHWAYPWVVLCLRHRELLRPHDPEAERQLTPPQWQRLHQVQYRLEEIVRGNGRFERLAPREGFAELLAMTVRLMAYRRGIGCEPTDVWQPPVMGDILPLAWEAVQTPIDRWSLDLQAATDNPKRRAHLTNALQWHGASSPFGLRGDLARYAAEPGHVLYPHAQEIRIPAEHRRVVSPQWRDTVLRLLPSQLPESLVVPDLTDFTPWLANRQAQMAAAQVGHMLVADSTLKEACDHLGAVSQHQVPLRRLWWNLESIGLFGEYLDEVRKTLDALVAQASLPDRATIKRGIHGPGSDHLGARFA